MTEDEKKEFRTRWDNATQWENSYELALELFQAGMDYARKQNEVLLKAKSRQVGMGEIQKNKAIAEKLSELARGQKPIPREFAEIIDEHLFELASDDEDLPSPKGEFVGRYTLKKEPSAPQNPFELHGREWEKTLEGLGYSVTKPKGDVSCESFKSGSS